MTVPPSALSPSRTAVFLSVLREPHPTYGTIMEATGLTRTTVRHHLAKLQEEGLVTWEPGTTGTIRAAVAVVATGNPTTPHRGPDKVGHLR